MQTEIPKPKPQPPAAQQTTNNENAAAGKDGGNNIAAQTFTFRELATATKNFRQECLIGEGGFGRVYKGKLESTDQVVAVKQLDRNGLQGNRGLYSLTVCLNTVIWYSFVFIFSSP